MGIEPKLLVSKVMHKRLTPVVNGFTYGVYYVVAPVSKLDTLARGRFFGVNRFGLFSLYEKDYGARDGTPLKEWIDGVLERHGITEADGETYLVTMPRILGYAFNPVSFWFCHDASGGLRAVVCEVNNTFREHHRYICAHPDHRPITGNDLIEARKMFHVSPFLKREGNYRFRFAQSDGAMGIWIDLFDAAGEKKLLTSVTGKLGAFSKSALLKAFFRFPLETVKVIYLIHWQALKLWVKGMKYVPKPEQIEPNESGGENLTDI